MVQRLMSIGKDNFTTYLSFPDKMKGKTVHSNSAANLKQQYKSTHLTLSAARRIKKILTHWIIAINLTQKQNKNRFQKKRHYLVFLTLTLPSKQIESDNEIKRKYLNNFLLQLKRHKKGILYLWVAEKQKNGNIHFHICIDQYVHKDWINEHWNQVLNTGDYIKHFQAKYGKKMPPSAHIEGQKHMKVPIEYLIKYVTKGVQSINLEGHKWQCSDELKHIYEIQLPVKWWFSDYLRQYQKDLNVTYYANEFAQCYYFKGNFLKEVLDNDIFIESYNYLQNHYSKIYPELARIKKTPPPVKRKQKCTLEQLELIF